MMQIFLYSRNDLLAVELIAYAQQEKNHGRLLQTGSRRKIVRKTGNSREKTLLQTGSREQREKILFAES